MRGRCIGVMTLGMYSFQPEQGRPFTLYCSVYPPLLLHVVTYTVLPKTFEIIDAKADPWSHSVFVALKLPGQFADYASELNNQHTTYLMWRDFELRYSGQQLIPSKPIDTFVETLRSGDYQRLVHEVQGVDPVMLARRLGATDPLITDACFIAALTECMKAAQCVWLDPVSYWAILFPENTLAKTTLTRLVEHGVIVRKEDSALEIAFAWAAQGLQAGALLEYMPGEPQRLLTEKTTKADERHALDKYIDKRQASNSMVIPRVPRTPSMVRVTQDVTEFHDFKDINIALLAIYETAVTPLVVLADRERLPFIKHKTGRLTGVVEVPLGSFKTGVMVTVDQLPNAGNVLAVTGGKDQRREVSDTRVVMESVRLVGRLPFEQYWLLSANDAKLHVISVETRFTAERWMWELEAFKHVTRYRLV